jgi:hypothetical protein
MAGNILSKAASIVTAGTLAAGAIKAASNIASRIRSRNIPDGAEAASGGAVVPARLNTLGSRDWRVKLSVPDHMQSSPLLQSLVATDGLVFPYTPTISITHAANYQPLDIVHSNYPYLAYQNSKVDSINISAKFYVEDSFEASYWVGAVHLLRSLTKMSFGESENVGAPPPIVRLSGYGDFVFNNVPVVVTSFSMDLPDDVDYISTGLGLTGVAGSSNAEPKEVSWAPVKSVLNIQLHPMYSRERIKKFNLRDFVDGAYVIDKTSGFI